MPYWPRLPGRSGAIFIKRAAAPNWKQATAAQWCQIRDTDHRRSMGGFALIKRCRGLRAKLGGSENNEEQKDAGV